jgi:hypothetical protein
MQYWKQEPNTFFKSFYLQVGTIEENKLKITFLEWYDINIHCSEEWCIFKEDVTIRN